MANPYIDVVADPKPGSSGYLKWYWTKGPGLAKWAASPHPFTALRGHLVKFVPLQYLNATVAQWFHDALGFWPGTPHVGPVPIGKK
jgi:hypothetical protein